MEREHAQSAMVSSNERWTGCYAWTLKNPRPIIPFPMKGKLSLWECDHEIEVLSAPTGGIPLQNICEKCCREYIKEPHSIAAGSSYRAENSERQNERVKKLLHNDNSTKTGINTSATVSIRNSEANNHPLKLNKGRKSEIQMCMIKVINIIIKTV